MRKLREAAEKRKIQNRMAQRRYRENLKRKLEGCVETATSEGETDGGFRELVERSEVEARDLRFEEVMLGFDDPLDGFGDERFCFDLTNELNCSPLSSPSITSPPPSYDSPDNLPYLTKPNTTPQIPLLHLAVTSSNPNIISILLDHGISTTTIDSTGKTALHLAASLGKTEIVTLMIDKGVDMEVRDGEGRTALMIAVEGGWEECVRVLVEGGAGLGG
ncbi:Ankyrin repeat-containing protein [Glarea lozoyensis ATCC 20868]|uniref:Ankyrin repeat-containing protein n=1 Tax=Glarea lozoyensis (strain ATCC 20868 / MF5171) TaxID=1116229 RepID=S3DHP9_GLAL2|nr:Ankyrin repeat-containing protein [Glarea lozoyensis ATCC 20868]EPE31566.1 Ankyrin repeat-containing protein [Glarea lozoyensis ATCC 20868]